MFSFGKRPKHRKFDYIPQHYDPKKEELEARIKGYRKGDLSQEEKAKHRITAGLRGKYYGNNEQYRQNHIRKSNLRLVYIIIILFFATYMMLKSDRLLRILETFG